MHIVVVEFKMIAKDINLVGTTNDKRATTFRETISICTKFIISLVHSQQCQQSTTTLRSFAFFPHGCICNLGNGVKTVKGIRKSKISSIKLFHCNIFTRESSTHAFSLLPSKKKTERKVLSHFSHFSSSTSDDCYHRLVLELETRKKKGNKCWRSVVGRKRTEQIEAFRCSRESYDEGFKMRDY